MCTVHKWARNATFPVTTCMVIGELNALYCTSKRCSRTKADATRPRAAELSLSHSCNGDRTLLDHQRCTTCFRCALSLPLTCRAFLLFGADISWATVYIMALIAGNPPSVAASALGVL